MSEDTTEVVTSEDPAATTETVATPAPETEAVQGEGTQAEEKTLTQSEVNEIIQREKAKAEAKAERRALKAYRETLERIIPKQQPQETEHDGRPSQSQYANVDEYVEAVTDWKLGQRDRAAEQRQQQEQYKSLSAKTEAYYAEAEKDPNFDRDVFNELITTDPIRLAIIDSDIPVKLMLYMSANPEEMQGIANLSPARQAAAIGRLEAKLESAPKPPKVSNAPNPITPIGSGRVADTGLSDNLSYEEWLRRRNKELGL